MVEGFPRDAENLSFHSLSPSLRLMPVSLFSCYPVRARVRLRSDLPNFIDRRECLVVGAAGVHPVPSRTRSLSLPASMVLGGQPPGRVDRRQLHSSSESNWFAGWSYPPTSQDVGGRV